MNRSAQHSTVPGTWRLFAPALIAWAFAAWAIGTPGASRRVLWLLLALALLILTFFASRRTRPPAIRLTRVTAVLFAFLLIVGVRIDSLEAARDDPVFQTEGSHSLTVTLTSFPRTIEQQGETRLWVLASAQARRGSVPLTLWGEGDPPGHWAPGHTLQVEGTLRKQEPNESSAYALNIRKHHDGGAAPYQRLLTQLRAGLTQTAREVPGAALVPGFAVGDVSLVTDDLDAAMKASSLTHLVAVSGSNCALVVSAISVGASWLGAPRRARILLAGAVLAAFVTLVGPDASIQRAAIMATVALVSRFGGRTVVAFPSLGMAIIILLVADPWQSREAGFTLSVAATAGILIFSPTIDRWVRDRVRAPAWFSVPLSVTVAAQYACGPLLLLLQPGLPVGGVFANLLAGVAAPLGTGLGLVALLMIPLHEGVGHLTTVLASLPARWVSAIAFTVQDIPLSRWHWPGGASGAILLTLCEGAAVAAVLIHGARERTPWERRTHLPLALRRALWVSGSAAAGILVAVSWATPALNRAVTPHNWFIVACDVGQGDAILIRDPEDPGRVMLTDTGDDAELLRLCLHRFGVSDITLLVLTHDDTDHVGALSEVVQHTKAALISRPVDGDTERRLTASQLEEAGIPFREGHAGIRGTLGGQSGVSWEILAPTRSEPIADTNPASIVMRVSVNGTNVLMLGDTSREEHEHLLARGVDIRVDIVKVAHHGSRDQDPRLLERTGARFGLISSGADNRYGHPSDDVLTALRESKIGALRTDELGSIALTLDGDSVGVWAER